MNIYIVIFPLGTAQNIFAFLKNFVMNIFQKCLQE